MVNPPSVERIARGSFPSLKSRGHRSDEETSLPQAAARPLVTKKTYTPLSESGSFREL